MGRTRPRGTESAWRSAGAAAAEAAHSREGRFLASSWAAVTQNGAQRYFKGYIRQDK